MLKCSFFALVGAFLCGLAYGWTQISAHAQGAASDAAYFGVLALYVLGLGFTTAAVLAAYRYFNPVPAVKVWTNRDLDQNWRQNDPV
jgi:hypothetical protein